ncbi:MAG: cytochrome c biogenesis protein CcsA [Arenicellales bacterium]|jgi:ABC-type uncharacterized transport system permease subunit|nr:cytochrome c biogenesis protein CcsA [Arenicellales bacterium]MDP6290214.1 cytochrome c biogenesis protein CcsA [Arenicellales bacterium]HJL66519.1 cytochrome c biogenesis protein CcsA [Arenicellales bacterium]|tara:strand:+ start:12 stop:827 length:816 start_codon:yes stop_codon:yes gene_type:complete
MSLLIPVTTLSTIALYLLASTLLYRQGVEKEEVCKVGFSKAFWIGVAALLLHAIALFLLLSSLEPGMRPGIGSALSEFNWVIILLLLLLALRQPVITLGIFVFPLAALGILIAWLAPGVPSASIPTTTGHLIAAGVAFGFLSLAGVQSILLIAQERHLRHHELIKVLRTLPPIETMEQVLFKLIWIGFVLFTVALISGLFFLETEGGKSILFNHHALLSIVAWIIFGILLFGRVALGWRGEHAARWTLGGFLLLALAYFGTRIIMEVFLNP